MLYPWECTALEWIGPRLHTRSGRPRTPAKLKAAPLAIGRVERERFEPGVWVEFPDDVGTFAVLFDGPRDVAGADVVGAAGWDRVWVHPRFRGRALLARVCAERFTRHGRSELDYLRQAVYGSGFTFEGRRLCLRAHRIAVLAAAARGVVVAPRVIESLEETEGLWQPVESIESRESKAAVDRP